jgi:hypothetical protein
VNREGGGGSFIVEFHGIVPMFAGALKTFLNDFCAAAPLHRFAR